VDYGGRGSIVTRSMTTRQIFRVVMNFLGTSKQQKYYFLGIFDHVYSIVLKHICILAASSKMWANGLVIQSMKTRTITEEVCQPYAQNMC
jgi:U3 small nucleolar RNA-associated protein 22